MLKLWSIPQSGYIAPKAMNTVLSALPRLKELELKFLSPRSRAVRATRYTPPLTRIILPVLTSFGFKGDSEYLEDFLSRIDAPLLSSISIVFFNQLLFNTPLLGHFINRTEGLKGPQQARIFLCSVGFVFTLSQRNSIAEHKSLSLSISCRPSDWLLSSLAQLCGFSLPPFSTLMRLKIYQDLSFERHWEDDMENTQWLELLQPFAFVEDLVLCDKTAGLVAPALQELIGEGVTDVLPALQNLFIEGPQPSGQINEAIGKFVGARRHPGHPITVLYNS